MNRLKEVLPCLALAAAIGCSPSGVTVGPSATGGTGKATGAGGSVGAAGGNGASGSAATSTLNGSATVAASTVTGGSTAGAASGGATTGAGAGSSGVSSSSTTGTVATASGTTGATGSTGTQCTNLQCDVVRCADGGATLITGRIMDPAGRDPLYGVVAYVPNSQVQPLPSGVPPPAAGAQCATCSSLFSGDPMAVGISDDDGNFTIRDAPATSGTVPLIVQVGKWRTHVDLSGVAACGSTDAGAISLPSKTALLDPIVNLPDIAVSTGGADSLECLLVRVGVDPTEYVPGNSTAGKVHIFNGGNPGGGGGFGGGGGGGRQETNLMSGAPDSDTNLWDSATDLSPYDLVLLSCEGGETYDAKPANLETYLNSGGRAFASHFHYAWFNGSASQGYTAPTDWDNLATWTTGTGVQAGSTADGNIVTTLFSGAPFPKGVALDAWLGNVNALGGSAGAGQLYIVAPKENASVSASNTPSQPWITDSSTDSTLYFSFDTPIGGYPQADGGAEYCGRAVFSGLHVGGASYDGVNCGGGGGGGGGGQGCNAGAVPAAAPPTGCDTSHPLSPQEKALEFMLFDLSSCVVPDTANPSTPPWNH